MIYAKVFAKVILENIRTLRKKLRKNVKIQAVLKADGYSLGDVTIAKIVRKHVDSFAIAAISEAERLRDAGITEPILLLGVCQDYSRAIELGLCISINSVNEMRQLISVVKGQQNKVAVQIKVNTGLNRFGISNLWELREILDFASSCKNVTVQGLYTHMAHEEDNIPGIDEQLRRFAPFRGLFKRLVPNGIVHAACSGSAEYLPCQFDMVRIGKIFYGGYPGYKTAVELKAKIVSVQKVAKGETIGYRGTFRASKSMIIGAIACGYADVASCAFSSGAVVYVDGVACRVLGRVCMDAFMVDVSEVKNPLGKMATIVSNKKGTTIMELCESTGMITCDFLCGLNFQRTKLEIIQ